MPKVHILHARLQSSLSGSSCSLLLTLHLSVPTSSHLEFYTFRAQPPSRWDSFLALLSSEYLRHTTTAHQRAYNRLRELRQERTALVAALKGAVNKTLATMVGAVGGLALAALAPDGHGGMWWVFLGVSLLGAGGFAVCIASYRPILAALWKQDAQG